MDNTLIMGKLNSDLQARLRAVCEFLQKKIVAKREPLVGFLYCTADYKKGTTFPDVNKMKPFAPTQRWGGKKDAHAWFYLKTAFEPTEYRRELHVDTQLNGWDASNPQFMLYVNGILRQGMDTNHRSAVINENGEAEIFLYAYTGTDIENLLDFNASIDLIDERVEKLYYDLFIPYSILKFTPLGSNEYNEILVVANEALNLLDLREIGSAEFYESAEKATALLKEKMYSAPLPDDYPCTSCFGHTHIDLAWLWQRRQTVEKAQRSFATMEALMSRYPDFKFMSSQVPLYKMVQAECPELFERIKARVKEGRWEPEGGMFVEADCNLSGGEALVRQFFYGKKYFREELGVDSKVLWLPDVFGYAAALPQIMKKCGVTDFVTSKISWNDSNQIPYDLFRWRGIDGTEILTHFITGQEVLDNGPKRFATYVARSTPSFIRGTYERYQQKLISKNAINTVGFGDGGGGTTPEDCEMVARQTTPLPGHPVTQWTSIKDYMQKVHEKADGNKFTPIWSGELYLELHRGTYTSQANNKKNNRKSEFLLQNVETASVISSAMGENTFDKQTHDEMWETVLFNQFHDILPGSSINGVYRDTDRDYAQISAYGTNAIETALNKVASKTAKKGLLVFNPNGYEYNGAVTVKGKRYEVKGIPAKGYAVVKPLQSKNLDCITFDGKTLENDFFRITFNAEMDVVSLFDKKVNRELIKPDQKICFTLYEDFPYDYDAWEVAMYYPEKQYAVNNVVSVNEITECDRKGVEIVRKTGSSTITDKIFLYKDKRLIEFNDDADWHEKHLLLKRNFPLDLISDKASCEIQFGYTDRPTTANTSWEKAKFEVCAHKYVDVSEKDYGVSLINDCKFGHGLYDNNISLSLLRAPEYPDPECDMGKHSFSYALYPHEGTLGDSEITKLSYEFNNPCYAVKANGGDGSASDSFSAVTAVNGSLYVDTVKPADNSDGTVIRCYEPLRTRGKETLRFGMPITKAYICDMLENEESEIPVVNGEITLDFKPFEIITVKVK